MLPFLYDISNFSNSHLHHLSPSTPFFAPSGSDLRTPERIWCILFKSDYRSFVLSYHILSFRKFLPHWRNVNIDNEDGKKRRDFSYMGMKMEDVYWQKSSNESSWPKSIQRNFSATLSHYLCMPTMRFPEESQCLRSLKGKVDIKKCHTSWKSIGERSVCRLNRFLSDHHVLSSRGG